MTLSSAEGGTAGPGLQGWVRGGYRRGCFWKPPVNRRVPRRPLCPLWPREPSRSSASVLSLQGFVQDSGYCVHTRVLSATSEAGTGLQSTIQVPQAPL